MENLLCSEALMLTKTVVKVDAHLKKHKQGRYPQYVDKHMYIISVAKFKKGFFERQDLSVS